MSPGQTTVPAWQRVLEDHATWQHWTAGRRVQWTADGVIVRDVPAVWEPTITAPAIAAEGAAMPPPRMRLWRLVTYALPRYAVTMVGTVDGSVVQLRIREK
jgi:hypothetical protein